MANEDGSCTIVVFAESLREAEQTAKARYPESAIKITFPIEPKGFSPADPIAACALISRRQKG